MGLSFQGPRGIMTQTFTIQQDGAAIKGTGKGQRGESSLEGSVTGNEISFTVKWDTPQRNVYRRLCFTVDGDSHRTAKGSIASGPPSVRQRNNETHANPPCP